MDKAKAKKILYILIIVAWMTVIFTLSNMGADESDGQSMGLSQLIVDGGAEFLHNIGILEEMPPREELDSIIEFINPPVRKCAHASEYFILTMLILFALRDKDTWNLDIKRACLIALCICFAYSLTDEFHQLFIPGRSGEFRDCINDTLGGCVAVALYLIGYKIKNRQNKEK